MVLAVIKIQKLKSMNNTTASNQEARDLELHQIKQKTVSGAISYFLRTLFLQGFGLGSAIILSWLLDPEDFGVYGFVIQIIGILTFISDIGFAAALIQKKQNPTLTDYRTTFTVQQILSWIIVALVLLLLATGLVSQKAGTAANWILLSLALSFPLASLKTISSVMLERRLDFSRLVLPQIVEQVLFHSILIWMAWNGYGALSYAYAIIARSIIGTAVMLYISPWSIGFAYNKQAFWELFGFGAKFQVNDFLARIKDQLFFLALGLVLPIREFGYIQWAKNWSLYPYMLTVQNVMAITFPTFSRLQHDRQLLGRAIEKSLYFISLFVFPILVGMIVFIGPSLAVIPAYAKWQPATFAFIWFTASVFWSALSTPLTNTLNAIGKINATLKLMVMWTTLTWVLTPIALWAWGYTGVAFAAFVISCTSFVTVRMVNREVPFRFLLSVGKQTFAAAAMLLVGLLGWEIWHHGTVELLGGMIITSATYGTVFLAIGWKQFWVEVASLRALRKN